MQGAAVSSGSSPGVPVTSQFRQPGACRSMHSGSAGCCRPSSSRGQMREGSDARDTPVCPAPGCAAETSAPLMAHTCPAVLGVRAGSRKGASLVCHPPSLRPFFSADSKPTERLPVPWVSGTPHCPSMPGRFPSGLFSGVPLDLFSLLVQKDHEYALQVEPAGNESRQSVSGFSLGCLYGEPDRACAAKLLKRAGQWQRWERSHLSVQLAASNSVLVGNWLGSALPRCPEQTARPPPILRLLLLLR